MLHKLVLALRIADMNTLKPIEKAKAFGKSLPSIKKAGGYAIFTQPMQTGSEIFIKAQGYYDKTIAFDGKSEAVAFLKPINSDYKPPVVLVVSKPTESGQKEIFTSPSPQNENFVLSGLEVIIKGKTYEIESFSGLDGKLVLSKPISEKLTLGTEIKVLREEN